MKAEGLCIHTIYGKNQEDRWLATNGDWYLGINAKHNRRDCPQGLPPVSGICGLHRVCAGILQCFGSQVGATTYYRRDDTLNYDYFQNTHPEFYQCLTEHSIVENPYQFYGSDLFTFALRHYLCGQNYYAGLEGASSYMKIGGTEGMLEALEEYRTTGKNRYRVPDHVVGKTDKTYNYVRIFSRSNESALGNLLADALRQYTGADLAAINAGTLTAELEEGEITESDLATSMLYGLNNHVVTVRCKGANLISILSTNNLTDAGESGPVQCVRRHGDSLRFHLYHYLRTAGG